MNRKMAVSLDTASDCTEDKKNDLIKSLITKTELILCTKPVNIWHIPSALNEVVSSVLSIISHGCIEDVNNKSSLWNFIFGLRVIRPDLWPTYELKVGYGNLSNEQLCTQWLEISIQSHCLSEQMWSLLNEKKRLCVYFYPWAFLRSKDYTDALIITLQALEKNSQDILATLDPSMMVKFYNKKKEAEPPHNKYTTMHTDGEEIRKDKTLNSYKSYFSDDYQDEADRRSTKNSSNLRVPCSSNENIFQVSPSFLKVDYSESSLRKPDSLDPRDFETSSSVIKTEKSLEDIANLFLAKTVRDSNVRREMTLSIDTTKKKIKDRASTPSSNVDIPESKSNVKVNYQHSSIIQPSPFLLKYLSSKAKLPLVENCGTGDSILQQIECNLNLKVGSVGLNSEFSSSAGQIHKGALSEIKNMHSYFSPSLSNSEIMTDSTTVSQKDIHKSFTKVNNCNSEATKPKRSHVRSYSDVGVINVSRLPEVSTNHIFSNSSLSQTSLDRSVKKRFMEDGGQSITPEADGFFPQPQPGESLIDFLSSNRFSKTCAQLDRENAHFNIAEAVLAALEQVNFKTTPKELRRGRDILLDESEEDVSRSRRYSSVRRKPRLRTRTPFFPETSEEEPVTTDNSVFDSPDPSSSEEEAFTDIETCSEVTEDQTISDDGISTENFSAENVAIAILRNYNARILPNASDLQWLVSEQDAPQKLLPIPTSIPVDPDEALMKNSDSVSSTLLRGTNDWAPPRPQLVLTLFKNIKRKDILIYQKYRCAGCGLSVSEKLSSHFNLCNYLGRYFCTNCHSNKKAVIPAKVLHSWDFKNYHVCNFSFELLGRMSCDPLFHLDSLNPRLYTFSWDLHQTHICRIQMYHARAYILTCSRALKETELLECVATHWYSEPYVYSMDDFLSVKKGNILQQVKHLTATCVRHISNCPVCMGRGFICEICRQGKPIFAFQLRAVSVCSKCGGCFHLVCFKGKDTCPRCLRRKAT